MKKLEAAFQTAFGRWVRYRYKGGSALFELKRTTKNSLPLSDMRPHQLDALRAAEKNGVFYKIPDSAMGYKPADCFMLNGAGYLVVAYGERLTGFYMIRIGDLDAHASIGKRSITEEDAARIGMYHNLRQASGKHPKW